MRLVDGNIQYREMSVKCDVKVSVLDNEATHLDVVQIIPCYCAVCGPTTGHWLDNNKCNQTSPLRSVSCYEQEKDQLSAHFQYNVCVY